MGTDALRSSLTRRPRIRQLWPFLPTAPNLVTGPAGLHDRCEAGPGVGAGWQVEQERGEGWTQDRQQESAKAGPYREGKALTLHPATLKGCGLRRGAMRSALHFETLLAGVRGADQREAGGPRRG